MFARGRAKPVVGPTAGCNPDAAAHNMGRVMTHHSRVGVLLSVLVLCIGACDGRRISNEEDGGTGPTVPPPSAPPADCLTEVPCVQDTDCLGAAGTRCNTALDSPLCQTIRCGAEGSVCHDDAVCPEGMRCLRGRCGTCADLPSGAECVRGVAVCSRPRDVVCGSACVTLATDASNCGACGSAVPAGATCVDGAPACPEGLTICGEECVDLTSDSEHCGACGNALEGAECIDGAPGCSGELSFCDGRCVDLAFDDAHCGACGAVCTAGYCSYGLCSVRSAERTSCSSVCAASGMTCTVRDVDTPGATYSGWCHTDHFGMSCAEVPAESVTCGSSPSCTCTFHEVSCACRPS